MKYRELDSLLIYEFLKNFAFSLVGIFIPVYIVSEGFGILSAVLFLAVSGVSGVLLSYPFSRLISRIGFKHSLASSYLLLLPGLILIRLLDLSIPVIVASAVLYSAGKVLHNIGMNSEFAVDSDESSRTSDSGKMLSLPSLSRIVAPVAGGLIFAGLGFPQLLSLTIGVLILSIIPLVISGDHRDPMEYDIRKLLHEEYLRTVPLFIARGIQGVTAVAVFGLFVYEFIGGSIDVGAARALDSLGFVATGLLVGRYVSNIDKRIFVAIGCAVTAATYMMRGFLATPLQVFIVSFVSGIFFQIYHVPIYSSFAEEAANTEILEFYTLRKVFVSLGEIMAVGALAIFYLTHGLKAGFIASFSLGAIATLIMAAVYWDNPIADE